MTAPTLQQIGERFRHAREDRGISQSEAAEAAGLTRSSVANFEAGRQDVPISKVVALCEAVGITIPVLWAKPDPCPACGCVWRGIAALRDRSADDR